VSLVSKLSKLGFAVWFAFSQVLFGLSAAYAQSDSIDVEPPLIEHSVIDAVEPTERQSFIATVVDDDELDSVSLFFRFQDDPTYTNIEMSRVSFSSTYIVHIPTDPDSSRNIEYYIQARDKAGNRTVRGFAFNPLMREINAPDGAVEPISTSAPPAKVESRGKGKTLLYVVLGVLAVGAIASAVDLGGSDPVEGCPNGLCSIGITVGPPQ